ncbi:MAG: class I SAM-dependent methyltransferase [Candidatus Aenigmatarchaeota archaeon]
MKTTSLAWKKVAHMWNTYFTPPSRISSEEFVKYREWLGRLNPGRQPLKALVLGATPEIRDLLAEFGYEAIVVDINPEMVRAMSSLMKRKNPKETVIIENWLKNDLPSGTFDVVIGDAVLPNIPWKFWERLLSEVKRVLKPDGTFVARAFCVPRAKTFQDMDELFDAFSTKEPSYRSALEFTLEVMIMFYDPEAHLATFQKSKEILESIGWDKGERTGRHALDEILKLVWDFWVAKFADKVFIFAYRDEEEALYSTFFEIKEIHESDSHYHEITPMFLMKPRS